MDMRTARAIVLLAVLVVQSMCLFGASYRVGPPDPVGEKVYTSGQLGRVAAPIAILASGFCAAWLVSVVRRHTRELAPDNSESYHC